MTGDASPALQLAVRLAGDERAIVGPLNGYHHEAYAVPLPQDGTLAVPFRWGKVRDPRKGLLWFDRRCFVPEEALLAALRGRVSRIPDVFEAEGVTMQRFVEGCTLGGPGADGTRRPLSDRHLAQLGCLFAELSAITWPWLRAAGVRRACEPRDHVKEDDSTAFLDRLIDFTRTKVYEGHGAPYRGLFTALGFDGRPLDLLAGRTWELAERPQCLLHGDLHASNFVVDATDDLWFIDWELALIGDPLYDLATHLHLMRYPEDETARVEHVWVEAVRARDGAHRWRDDLPLLLAYKRVQSVYTDVIRAAMRLAEEAGRGTAGRRGRCLARRVRAEAAEIARAVALARASLGEGEALSPENVEDAFHDWLRAGGR